MTCVVTAADVREAARLALPHRRRRGPFDDPGMDQQRLDDALGGPDDVDDGDDTDPPPDGGDEVVAWRRAARRRPGRRAASGERRRRPAHEDGAPARSTRSDSGERTAAGRVGPAHRPGRGR